MENTLHCNVCNFTGITQTHFIKHILTQKHKRNGQKKMSSFNCTNCDYKVNNSYHMKIHTIMQHGTSQERKDICPHYCADCDVGFFASLFFENHMKSKKHSNRLLIKSLLNKNNTLDDANNNNIEC
jgi:hypothetical protein